ncbi:MAG TPA: flavin reductase family protein [Ktedonobacteraceae bacterium]
MHLVQNQSTPPQQLPLYRYFASTVALITSQSEGQQRNVMACEWTMNVCRHPLKIMTLINKDDLTHELIMASGEFGVNLCSEEQSSLSHFAGSNTGREEDKLHNTIFNGLLYTATRIQAPMIRGCVLNAECVVEQAIDMGKHTAFIGRALAARLNPNLRPLLYHQGCYLRCGEVIPKPEHSAQEV